jgi:hypothetical protein
MSARRILDRIKDLNFPGIMEEDEWKCCSAHCAERREIMTNQAPSGSTVFLAKDISGKR